MLSRKAIKIMADVSMDFPIKFFLLDDYKNVQISSYISYIMGYAVTSDNQASFDQFLVFYSLNLFSCYRLLTVVCRNPKYKHTYQVCLVC